MLLQIFLLLFENIKLLSWYNMKFLTLINLSIEQTDSFLYLSKHFRINFKSLGLSKSIIISGYDIMAAIEL